jgi:MoxR-like ATPase
MTESAENHAPDVDDVRRRINENRKAGLAYFSAQRADEWQALDACLLSRHHCLLLGPPGEGKSLLARTWADAIVGGAYREALCTRQSTEQDLFYYLDVPAFTQGRSVYKYEGKLSEGYIQFWDECFKLNGGTLNAGLGLLNERTVAGGFRSPLCTAIGASNEMGEDDSVAALEDRWLARFWIDTLSDANFEAFLLGRVNGAKAPTLQSITVDEIAAAQAAVAALPVDPDVIRALRDLRKSLAGVGITVSPRRGGWCVEYLRAVAWLDGAPAVMVDHVDVLRNVLWRRPEDKPAVEAAIGAIDRGVIGEIRALVDQVVAAYEEDRARLSGAEWYAAAAVHARTFYDTGKGIQDRFGKGAPGYRLERVRGYMGELRAAYGEAKAEVEKAKAQAKQLRGA